MKVIVDRFEGNTVVCEKEDRSMIDIDITKLPPGIQVGDVVVLTAEKCWIDNKSTTKLKQHIQALTDDLWE